MTKCRVLEKFTWNGVRYHKDREFTPGAELRKQFLRRGLIEVIGKEAVTAKEKKAQAEDVAVKDEQPKPRKRRNVVA